MDITYDLQCALNAYIESEEGPIVMKAYSVMKQDQLERVKGGGREKKILRKYLGVSRWVTWEQ